MSAREMNILHGHIKLLYFFQSYIQGGGKYQLLYSPRDDCDCTSIPMVRLLGLMGDQILTGF